MCLVSLVKVRHAAVDLAVWQFGVSFFVSVQQASPTVDVIIIYNENQQYQSSRSLSATTDLTTLFETFVSISLIHTGAFVYIYSESYCIYCTNKNDRTTLFNMYLFT